MIRKPIARVPQSARRPDAIANGDSLSVYMPPASQNAAGANFAGEVVHCTIKAVRVRLDAARGGSHSLWVPRRALIHLRRNGSKVAADLARWWQPDPEQARVLYACQQGRLVA
jgi:hypothetical protein